MQQPHPLVYARIIMPNKLLIHYVQNFRWVKGHSARSEARPNLGRGGRGGCVWFGRSWPPHCALYRVLGCSLTSGPINTCAIRMEWLLCVWNGLRVHMYMEWVACAWNGLRVHGMGFLPGIGFVRVEWVACAWNGLRVHGMEYICAGHDIFVYIILSALECHTIGGH